jgi:hypothetical protein
MGEAREDAAQSSAPATANAAREPALESGATLPGATSMAAQRLSMEALSRLGPDARQAVAHRIQRGHGNAVLARMASGQQRPASPAGGRRVLARKKFATVEEAILDEIVNAKRPERLRELFETIPAEKAKDLLERRLRAGGKDAFGVAFRAQLPEDLQTELLAILSKKVDPSAGKEETPPAPTPAATETPPAPADPATEKKPPAEAPAEKKPAEGEGKAAEESQEAGPGKPPVVTASKPADVARALEVLTTALPIKVSGGAMGDVELRPGDHVQGKMILYPTPLATYYLDGTKVYKQWTPDFVRGIWLTAIGQGAKGAEWIVPWLKAVMSLVMNFVAPMIATGVSVVELLVKAHANWDTIKAAHDAWTRLSEHKELIKKHYPMLHEHVIEPLWSKSLSNMASNFQPKDVASVLGRILGGGGNVAGGIGLSVGKGVVASVRSHIIGAITTAIIPAALAVASATVHAAAATTKQAAEELKAKLEKDYGVELTEEQAHKIIKELAGGNKEAREKLDGLKSAAEDAARHLETLQKAWEK